MKYQLSDFVHKVTFKLVIPKNDKPNYNYKCIDLSYSINEIKAGHARVTVELGDVSIE